MVNERVFGCAISFNIVLGSNEYFLLCVARTSYDKQFLHNLAVSTAINNFQNMFLMYIVKCPTYLYSLRYSFFFILIFTHFSFSFGFDIFSIFNWHMYLQISRDWHNKLIWRGWDRIRVDNNDIPIASFCHFAMQFYRVSVEKEWNIHKIFWLAYRFKCFDHCVRFAFCKRKPTNGNLLDNFPSVHRYPNFKQISKISTGLPVRISAFFPNSFAAHKKLTIWNMSWACMYEVVFLFTVNNKSIGVQLRSNVPKLYLFRLFFFGLCAFLGTLDPKLLINKHSRCELNRRIYIKHKNIRFLFNFWHVEIWRLRERVREREKRSKYCVTTTDCL